MPFLKNGLSKNTALYYIIKWLTDYITDYGVDGYRADTVKHTEESVWADLKNNAIMLLPHGSKKLLKY
jgi:alpha-amylase